jgi:hypothetical protein
VVIADGLYVDPARQRCRGELHRPDCDHLTVADPPGKPGRPARNRRSEAQRARQARSAFVRTDKSHFPEKGIPTHGRADKRLSEHETIPLSTLTNIHPRVPDEPSPNPSGLLPCACLCHEGVDKIERPRTGHYDQCSPYLHDSFPAEPVADPPIVKPMLATLIPEARARVDEYKRQIAEGTYGRPEDSPIKWPDWLKPPPRRDLAQTEGAA